VAACDGVSEKVTIINRNPDRENTIRKSALSLDIDFISWTSSIDFGKYDLVVNTTPGNTASVFRDQIGSVASTFFEVLYNPWPTQLLEQWRKAGGFGIDGLDLLIHQAISQVEIFASREIDRFSVAKMLRLAGQNALS
jgi:shikimate dehydrogenase